MIQNELGAFLALVAFSLSISDSTGMGSESSDCWASVRQVPCIAAGAPAGLGSRKDPPTLLEQILLPMLFLSE